MNSLERSSRSAQALFRSFGRQPGTNETNKHLISERQLSGSSPPKQSAGCRAIRQRHMSRSSRSLLGHHGHRRRNMGKSEFDPAGNRPAWNAGRKVGAKRALKPRQVWAIRFFLDQHRRMRDRALFDLAIDSKLRGCDVVKVRIGDLVLGGQVRSRAIVVQGKTGKPVQFELMQDARASLLAWLERRGGTLADYVGRARCGGCSTTVACRSSPPAWPSTRPGAACARRAPSSPTAHLPRWAGPVEAV